MKKSVSFLIATIFASNSLVMANETSPCAAVYQQKLDQFQESFEATLGRSAKSGKVGGIAVREKLTEKLGKRVDDTADQTRGAWGSNVTHISILAMHKVFSFFAMRTDSYNYGLQAASEAGRDQLAREYASAKAFSQITTSSVGLTLNFLITYWINIDGNFDGKEITHPKSTIEFNKYVNYLFAHDVLSEVYQGRDSILQKIQTRLSELKDISPIKVTPDEQQLIVAQVFETLTEEQISEMILSDNAYAVFRKTNLKRKKDGLPSLKIEEFSEYHTREKQKEIVDAQLTKTVAKANKKIEKQNEKIHEIKTRYTIDPETTLTPLDMIVDRINQKYVGRGTKTDADEVKKVIRSMEEKDPQTFCKDEKPTKRKNLAEKIAYAIGDYRSQESSK
jgi:phosphopantetheine adenylyltransferase